jgi:hypothetical protein
LPRCSDIPEITLFAMRFFQETENPGTDAIRHYPFVMGDELE